MARLKFAFRTLLKTPSITLIAIISLGLGIGSTTAIFSLFNQMLMKPLPVPAPDRLVNLSAPGPKPGSQSCNSAGNCDVVFSYTMFRDLEKEQTSFTGIAAHRTFGANLAYHGQTTSGEGMLVSGSYFDVLGLKPALGRLIGSVDDRAIGESPVVVLSHDYWRTRFSESPSVLNELMIVNGISMTIIGVAPAGFDGTTLGERPQVYVPITMRGFTEQTPQGFENRRNYWAYLFARLKPGVSIEQAGTAINVPYHAIINDVEAPLQKGMSPQTLERFKVKKVTLEPGYRGQSTLHQEAQTPLLVLLVVTGVVLLIACANIANLLLARAAARTGEMAIRLSIGASRKNLIGQLLTESCLLAVLGGVAGLIVARWTIDLIVSLLPSDASLILKFQLDWPVVFFGAAVTIGTGIVFGLFPALHSTRPDVLSSLKGQTGQPSGARSAARFRTVLATTQIALSMALLVSAASFAKSLFNISRIDLGLKIDNMITFSISPELNGYKPAQSRALFERLENELSAQPGVTGVTASLVGLLTGNNWGNDVSVQGFQGGPDVDSNSRYNEVGPGYFRTMGIPLMSGREFTDADAFGAPKVAIVNEQFAKKFNLGRDAVGKRMKQGGGGQKDLDVEIVGLVQNAKYSQVKSEVPPLFFTPYRQDDRNGSINFYVRGAMDAERILSIVQPVVSRVDPNLPVENLRTMQRTVQDNIAVDRIISVLSAAFAGLATALAAVGLYGVLAYTVAQRTREFGVRMALGADPARVRTMVLRQVGLMTIVGGVIGLAAAIGLVRLAQSLLYKLEGSDPVVLIGSAIALTFVAVVAGFVPARRASRVDPMTALRYE
jgi:putative ABC transport system permease protein